MKQTNNAIKFLMAQYRAIYQNAYFKGLTTAAILTLGLAVGQANAAPGNNLLEQDDNLPQGKTVLVIDGATSTGSDQSGEYQNIQFKGDGAQKFANVSIKVTGGVASTDSTNNNFIAGGVAATTFTAKSLTIETKDATHGLTITANNGQTATANFDNVDVKAGLLKINQEGTGFKGSLDTKAITIGSTDPVATTAAPEAVAAKVLVGKNGVLGKEIVKGKLSDLTKVTIGTNGTLSTLTPTNAAIDTITVNAADLNIKGGSLEATAKDAHSSTLTVNLVKGAVDNGTIKVAKNATANITFSNLEVTDGTNAIAKELDLNSGKLDVAGNLNVSGSGAEKVTLAKEVAVAGSGNITFTKTNLETSIEALNAAAGKANVKLDAGSLLLTDESVDLSKIKFAKDNAAVATSTIGVANDTKLKVKNTLALADEKNIVFGSFDAANFDLGKETKSTFTKGLTASKGVALTGEVTVKDLTLDNGFAQINKDKSIDKVTAADLLGKEPGKISAKASGASLVIANDQAASNLNIDNGSWVNDVKLTLGSSTQSGNLVVGKEDTTNKTAAKLDFAKGSALTLTNGDITVGKDGATKLLEATLDLSKLEEKDITLTAGSINVTKNGTLVADKDFVAALAKDSNKATLTVKGGGALDLQGQVSLDAATIVSNQAAANKIYLSGAAGSVATVKADDLTLTKADAFALGANNKIDADKLTLNGDSAVKLGAGEYLVHDTLAGNKDITFNGSNLTLEQTKASGASTVSANVILGVDQKSNLSITKGDWTLKDVNVASGAFTVNGKSSVTSDGKLTVGDHGAITIDADSKATFAKLDQQHNSDNSSVNITVNGKLTFNGVKPTETKAQAANKDFGVTTAENSIIKVSGNEAVLTLGANALGALGDVVVESGNIKYDTAAGFNDPFKGKVELADYGTLALDFAPGKKFSLEQIKALRKEFTGSADVASQVKGFIKVNAEVTDLGVTNNNGKYEISYDKLGQAGDISDLQIANLEKAQVTGVKGEINHHVGSIQLANGTNKATVGVASLSTALADTTGTKQFVVDNSGKAANIEVNAKGYLGLNNGGHAATITLADGSSADSVTTLDIKSNGAKTSIDAISADNANNVVLISTGETEITGEAKVGALKTSKGTTLNVKDLTTKAASELNGTFKATGTVNFDKTVTLNGTSTFENGFTASELATIAGETTVNKGKTTFTKGAEIVDGATLNAKEIESSENVSVAGKLIADSFKLASSKALSVGNDESAGTLEVKTLNLNDGALVLDPDWKKPASLAIIGNDKPDAINVSGSVGIGQNAAFLATKDASDAEKAAAKAILARYTNGNGALSENGIGALLIVNKQFTVESGKKVIVNPSLEGKNLETEVKAASNQNSVTLASGSALVVGEALTNEIVSNDKNAPSKAAISFGAQSGTATFTAAAGSSVIFDGNVFAGSKINLTDAKTVTLTDASVKAANGLLTLDNNNGGTLTFKRNDKAAELLYNQSAPIKDLTLAVIDGKFGTSKLESGVKYIHTINGANGGQAVEDTARLAIYGGAVQGTALAQQAANDAVVERMSRANPNGSLVFANNAQGGGLWLSPVYKSHDSDSFDADGVEYGVDGDLTGLVLGADSTTASGVRIGGYFNFGSASFDGQGVGSQVSNDADYFGFGLYAGMTAGQFSLVADAGFTQVSNDLEQSTGNAKYSKIKADVDSSAVTLGLRGEYKLNVATMDVTPHLGVRYTRLNVDSYDAKHNGEVLAATDFDTLQMFSIPFGVTLSKDITAGDWSIKPVFDLTLTANAGDTDAKLNTTFIGANSLDLNSEAFDSFTYGATLGIDAKYGENFSIGLNTNYTGSSNADEFGVMGNARYMF